MDNYRIVNIHPYLWLDGETMWIFKVQVSEDCFVDIAYNELQAKAYCLLNIDEDGFMGYKGTSQVVYRETENGIFPISIPFDEKCALSLVKEYIQKKGVPYGKMG